MKCRKEGDECGKGQKGEPIQSVRLKEETTSLRTDKWGENWGVKRSQPREERQWWGEFLGRCLFLYRFLENFSFPRTRTIWTREATLAQVGSDFHFFPRCLRKPNVLAFSPKLKSAPSQFPVRSLLREAMTFLMGTSSTAGVRGTPNFSCKKLVELQGQDVMSGTHQSKWFLFE